MDRPVLGGDSINHELVNVICSSKPIGSQSDGIQSHLSTSAGWQMLHNQVGAVWSPGLLWVRRIGRLTRRAISFCCFSQAAHCWAMRSSLAFM